MLEGVVRSWASSERPRAASTASAPVTTINITKGDKSTQRCFACTLPAPPADPPRAVTTGSVSFVFGDAWVPVDTRTDSWEGKKVNSRLRRASGFRGRCAQDPAPQQLPHLGIASPIWQETRRRRVLPKFAQPVRGFWSWVQRHKERLQLPPRLLPSETSDGAIRPSVPRWRSPALQPGAEGWPRTR